jgi:hypothetical protein
MEMPLNRTALFTKSIIYSLIFFLLGFVVFYVIQYMTTPMQSSITVQTGDSNHSAQLGKDIIMKRASFIVLIVCSFVATIFTWHALAKRKSTIYYIIFGVELLTTISVLVFFLWAQTQFWM